MNGIDSISLLKSIHHACHINICIVHLLYQHGFLLKQPITDVTLISDYIQASYFAVVVINCNSTHANRNPCPKISNLSAWKLNCLQNNVLFYHFGHFNQDSDSFFFFFRIYEEKWYTLYKSTFPPSSFIGLDHEDLCFQRF